MNIDTKTDNIIISIGIGIIITYATNNILVTYGILLMMYFTCIYKRNKSTRETGTQTTDGTDESLEIELNNLLLEQIIELHRREQERDAEFDNLHHCEIDDSEDSL